MCLGTVTAGTDIGTAISRAPLAQGGNRAEVRGCAVTLPLPIAQQQRWARSPAEQLLALFSRPLFLLRQSYGQTNRQRPSRGRRCRSSPLPSMGPPGFEPGTDGL